MDDRLVAPAHPSVVGFTLLEMTLVVAIGVVLLTPLVGLGVDLRSRGLLRNATESAAALLAQARWAAVSRGSASVEFEASPPVGRLLSEDGEILALRDLGAGDVKLHLSRGRGSIRIRYGSLGLGVVSSQTLRFTHGGNEEALIVSSLGRVRRRE